jgi:hypothetical protein
MARQLAVQLDNRPGGLAHFALALAARAIDSCDIAGAGAGDRSAALLTPSDDRATRQVLHRQALRPRPGPPGAAGWGTTTARRGR